MNIKDYEFMTEEKYIAKYEEKYGKLDEDGKKHVLKYRNSLNGEELDKMLEEWVGEYDYRKDETNNAANQGNRSRL